MITRVITERLPRVKAVLFLKKDIDIALEKPTFSPYAEYIIALGQKHLITVNPEADPIIANFFLWHELGHALQCERLGAVRFKEQYQADLVAAGFPEDFAASAISAGDHDTAAKYNQLPLEREANQIASKWADLHQVLI